MVFFEQPSDFRSKFNIVSCFVEQGGKFLLLLRQDAKPQDNTWGVPAGKVAEGETEAAAMQRELAEETGYSGLPEPNFVSMVYIRYPEYDFVYHIFRLFVGENYQVKIDLACHKDFTWVTPREALSMRLIPELDQCIKLCYPV